MAFKVKFTEEEKAALVKVTLQRLREHAQTVAGIIPKQDIASGADLLEELWNERNELKKKLK